MARKLKFREPTDVVSVRMPISLIERLDELCRSLRVGRAEFFVSVVRKFPDLPRPAVARAWLANMSWVAVGGGAALLAAMHGGAGSLSERMSPARHLARAPLQLEADRSGAGPSETAPPLLPPRDPRLDPAWRFGNLQGFIPRGADRTTGGERP